MHFGLKRIAALLAIGAASHFATLSHAQEKTSELHGEIRADGSSTVYLITEAMVTDFKKVHPKVNKSIGISGTGGGFRKFANNETDIQNASRKIKPAEAEACKKAGVEYIEIQVAWDGLAVVVSKENTYAKKLTMDQLKKIWNPENPAKNWSEVDPSFPAEKIELWGAGKDSGTFDYFTEAVNHKEKYIRQDYNPSEDDNVLVNGVSKSNKAMGFFGVAYLKANEDKVHSVSLAKKAGEEYYAPTEENVLSGKYPISRPLFIYVKKSSLQRPEIREFVNFYVRHSDLVKKSGYVPLTTIQNHKERKKLEAAMGTGAAAN